MDGERRMLNQETLTDLLQRTARIEERSVVRGEWQVRVEGEIKEIRAKVGGIEAKLDDVLAELQMAKTALRAGSGAVGWVLKLIPAGGVGAAVASALHYLWPAK